MCLRAWLQKEDRKESENLGEKNSNGTFFVEKRGSVQWYFLWTKKLKTNLSPRITYELNCFSTGKNILSFFSTNWDKAHLKRYKTSTAWWIQPGSQICKHLKVFCVNTDRANDTSWSPSCFHPLRLNGSLCTCMQQNTTSLIRLHTPEPVSLLHNSTNNPCRGLGKRGVGWGGETSQSQRQELCCVKTKELPA